MYLIRKLTVHGINGFFEIEDRPFNFLRLSDPSPKINSAFIFISQSQQLFFVPGTDFVDQTGLELTEILLPLPPKY